MVAVTPTAAANALLRPAIHEFELAMDPLVKAWAKTKWGEVQEVGWKRPKWAHICYNCVGKDMRPFFDHEKLLDAFTLGEVVQKHIVEFVQASLPTLSDAERERYRNDVHHVGFIRNALAHPPEPNAAMCVMGVDAVLGVLRAHGAIDEAGVQALERLRARLRQIDGADPSAAAPLQVAVSAEELRVVVLESALQHFSAEVGGAILCNWNGAGKPAEPMELSGAKQKHTIFTVLNRSQSNKLGALRGWPAYQAWALLPDTSDEKAACGLIRTIRNQRNHAKHDHDLARVAAEVQQLHTIQTSLRLRTDRLEALRDALKAVDAGAPPVLELSETEPWQTVGLDRGGNIADGGGAAGEARGAG